MLQIEGIKLNLDQDEALLREKAAAALRVPAESIRKLTVLRRAVDLSLIHI